MSSIYFLDIDDCLIHTSALREEHLNAIKKSLDNLKIPYSSRITNEFKVLFQRLYDHHQGKKLKEKEHVLLDKYLAEMKKLEKPVLEKYGEIKRWSREVCLFIAAKKYGVTLTNNQIIPTTNALWEEIGKSAVFYKDSYEFLAYLLKNNDPFYLITSSDSRLTLNDKTHLFNYDPDYSRSLKLKRLQKFIDLGIPKKHIFIGDPYDKPKTWVFEEALKCAFKEVEPCKARFNLPKITTIMVGDSLTNDLFPAQKAGIEKLVLLDRSKKIGKNDLPEEIILINSLRNLLKKMF